MNNEFVDINGYFGKYKINKLGVIISYQRYKSGSVMKPYKTKDGYLRVCLCNDGKPKNFFVHRLVAESFIGNSCGKEINHKDGEKTNNNVENLEYVTHQQNIIHSYRTLGNKSPYKGMLGEKHHSSKVVMVDSFKFNCLREAAKFIGTSNSRLREHIVKNKLLDGFRVFDLE